MIEYRPLPLTVGNLLDIIIAYCFIASILEFIATYLDYRDKVKG